LLFALEVVVDKRDSGDILLNPGDYCLPKPYSRDSRYTYFGYIIAEDLEEAEQIFKKYANEEEKEREF